MAGDAPSGPEFAFTGELKGDQSGQEFPVIIRTMEITPDQVPTHHPRKPGRLKTWLLASRPRTLPVSLAPILVGLALALRSGPVALSTVLVILVCVLLIQIGTNFANDYYDHKKGADHPGRKGPLRATQSGWLSPTAMKKAYLLTFAVCLLPGAWLVHLGGWPIIAIGLLSLLFGYLYTGGPFPLAYNGLGDVTVLVFFGPVAVAGTEYLLSGSWSLLAGLTGLGPGMLATAVLVVNNTRDEHEDRASRKMTLVARFGRRFGRWEYTGLLAGAFLVPVVLFLSHADGAPVPRPALLLPLLLAPMTAGYLRLMWTFKNPLQLNPLLGNTALLLLLYSVAFALGIVL